VRPNSPPDKVRKLQRRLWMCAKQSRTRRFHALYDRIYRGDVLWEAWKRVRRNRGSAGVDRESLEAIEAQGVEAWLEGLQAELRAGRYRPRPVKRRYIPKGQGGRRPLGIPTVRDRVVQMATKLVIEPIFEADFRGSSFGFRPRRSATQALERIRESGNQGYNFVLDADIRSFFDQIDQEKLMLLVERRISDRRVLKLLRKWLRAGVMEDGTIRETLAGTPQGGVISPLLANLYLHLLDRLWKRQHLQRRLEARLVRYADDFVVLCRKGTEQPMAVIRRVLDRLGLRLNEQKTQVVNAKAESFDFLGFEFRMRASGRTGGRYPHVKPSKKSLQKIKSELTALTHRRLSVLPLPVVMKRVNQALVGWVGYFHYRNCSRSLEQLRAHAEQRVRTHLCKRHKVRSRWEGYIKFPNKLLYEKYGLFKVPTTAGWTRAHALR